MTDKRIKELEQDIKLRALMLEQQDSALAEIMKRTIRASTLDLASARKTLEEIHAIAKKARGFQD